MYNLCPRESERFKRFGRQFKIYYILTGRFLKHILKSLQKVFMFTLSNQWSLSRYCTGRRASRQNGEQPGSGKKPAVCRVLEAARERKCCDYCQTEIWQKNSVFFSVLVKLGAAARMDIVLVAILLLLSATHLQLQIFQSHFCFVHLGIRCWNQGMQGGRRECIFSMLFFFFPCGKGESVFLLCIS